MALFNIFLYSMRLSVYSITFFFVCVTCLIFTISSLSNITLIPAFPAVTTESPEEEILWAAERGLSERVGQLLRQDAALVQARDEDGYTPLHRAAYNDHLAVVEVRLRSRTRETKYTQSDVPG